jgi:hypothetical protein
VPIVITVNDSIIVCCFSGAGAYDPCNVAIPVGVKVLIAVVVARPVIICIDAIVTGIIGGVFVPVWIIENQGMLGVKVSPCKRKVACR